MKRAFVGLFVTLWSPSVVIAQLPVAAAGLDTAGFDRSTRPQDDFFSFVNGGWITRASIPPDRGSLTYAELEARTEVALRRIVEAAAKTRSPSGSPGQIIGDFYASLLDSAAIERDGIRPLEPFLREVSRLRDSRDLPATFARLGHVSVRQPILAVVVQDPKESNTYALTLRQWGLGLPARAMYLRSDSASVRVRNRYEQHIRAMLTLAEIPNASEAAARVIKLETRLARAHWDPVKNRDPIATYNKLTLVQLQLLSPHFDWNAHFGALGLPPVKTVVVRQPSYFASVDTILQETTIADWKSYLQFHIVSALAGAGTLPHAFTREHYAMMYGVLSGVPDIPPRWQRALFGVQDVLGDLLGRFYVEQEVPPSTRRRAEVLVRTVATAFRVGIDSLDWMSDSTKAHAKAKLDLFRFKVAYPDRWKDYSALSVLRGDAAGNNLRAQKFWWDDQYSRLGRLVDKDEWVAFPQEVNAYYHPGRHELVLPAANLQPPLFDEQADDALTFGAIGRIIGHEISHAFDDQGRQYDGNGNLRDWWTAEDATVFRQRADRLVEQYSSYSPIAGLFVNGQRTLGENISDLCGLAVAYRAYRLSLQGREAPVIDGFTGDQRFFLAFAQAARSVSREQAVRNLLLTDSHAPEAYRVNGVLVNFDPFYAAWNVTPGDKMYLPPERRVRLW